MFGAGCASLAPVVNVSFSPRSAEPSPPICAQEEVLVYFADLRPSGDIKPLGEIKVVLGGGERHLRPVVEALKAEAHRVGANAVIQIEGVDIKAMEVDKVIRAQAVAVDWTTGG